MRAPAGWLLRVACNEQLREEFVTMHEAVQEILKVREFTQWKAPGGCGHPHKHAAIPCHWLTALQQPLVGLQPPPSHLPLPLTCCAQSDNLAQLPGGRDLPMADYANLTKAVRRSLKQVCHARDESGS